MYAIIEDDIAAQEHLDGLIHKSVNCDTLRYTTAEDFFGDIKTRDLDIKAIFLDESLPGMSCLEALNKINSSDGYKEIPVIVCSSSNETKVILKTIESGAANYLVKPLAKESIEPLLMTFP